jgi:hypothetical protein
MEHATVEAAWKGELLEGSDPNTFVIAATKVGAKCFTSTGLCLKWTAPALEDAAGTWVEGPVSANHKKSKKFGKITASEYAKPEVHMTVTVDDYMAGWISRNKKEIGVSIEANVTYDENLEIVSATGTGVTFVFPPESGACSLEEGCMVLATEGGDSTHTDGVVDANSEGEIDMTEVSATEKKALDRVAEVEATLATKEAEVSAAKKRIGELEAEVAEKATVIATYVETEKAEIMATLKECLGDEVAAKYADKPICQLRDIATAVSAFKAKAETEEPEGSGAKHMDRQEGVNATQNQGKSAMEVEAEATMKEYNEKYRPLLEPDE